MPNNKNIIKVEVAYAGPDAQHILSLEIEAGSTIGAAIERSGIMEKFPEIDLSRQKVGIFSKQHALTDLINDGDRVEIYRPLIIDPKEARRAKARTAKKT